MDDESPQVRAAVLAEWKRGGAAGMLVLREWERGSDRWLAVQAREMLEAMGGLDPLHQLREDLHAGRVDLESALLRLEQSLGWRGDPEGLSRALDGIAARVRELQVLPSSPWARCRLLNRVLFHEYGLRAVGPRPEHGLLAAAWRSRRATPVALAATYMLVARRAGLELDLVWHGTRWWVGHFGVRPLLLVDPLAQGAFRTLEQFRDGMPGPVDPRPVTPVEAVMEVCFLWSEGFRRAGDHRRGLVYRRLQLECFEVQAMQVQRRREGERGA